MSGNAAMCLPFITVVLGLKPGEEALKRVPTFSGNKDEKVQEKRKDNAGAQPAETEQAALQATTLSLVNTHSLRNAPAKTMKVWLGEGMGSILKTGAGEDVENGIHGPGGIPSEVGSGEDGIKGQHQ